MLPNYEDDFNNRIKKYILLLFAISLLVMCIVVLISPVNAISIFEIKQICKQTNQYPIGSIYTSISPVNPEFSLGFGKWVRFGEARVMIGQSNNYTELLYSENIGGTFNG
jgi:hypothetical protein